MTPNLIAADISERNKLQHLRPVRIASYLVCGVLLVLAATRAFRMFRAASFLYAMSPPPQRLRVINLLNDFQHDPVMTHFWIQGRGGPLEIRMLTPKGLPNAPIVVLVHGFAPTGVEDGGLNQLGGGLCRSGLRVVMPNVVSEEKVRINTTALTDVDDAIRWSARTSGEKVSVLGISFSGGMVISAAANPDYTDYVKLVFCVSGYNSIDRLGRYYLHEDVRSPDSHRYTVTPPPNALAPMALQYLDELVRPGDVAPLSEALRMNVLDHRSIDTLPAGSLTQEQHTLLDDVLSVRTSAMRLRYHAILERHRAELSAMSPMGKINQVHGSLYVLHGDSDRTIPSAEAEWTREEAKHKSNAKVVISPWIDHAVLVPQAKFREKIRVVYAVSEILDEALHPVPLERPKG